MLGLKLNHVTKGAPGFHLQKLILSIFNTVSAKLKKALVNFFLLQLR